MKLCTEGTTSDVKYKYHNVSWLLSALVVMVWWWWSSNWNNMWLYRYWTSDTPPSSNNTTKTTSDGWNTTGDGGQSRDCTVTLELVSKNNFATTSPFPPKEVSDTYLRKTSSAPATPSDGVPVRGRVLWTCQKRTCLDWRWNGTGQDSVFYWHHLGIQSGLTTGRCLPIITVSLLSMWSQEILRWFDEIVSVEDVNVLYTSKDLLSKCLMTVISYDLFVKLLIRNFSTHTNTHTYVGGESFSCDLLLCIPHNGDCSSNVTDNASDSSDWHTWALTEP
jgi:hypothetical protein